MDKLQLEQKIVKALDQNKFCTFATIEGSKPKARYMALFHEGLSIHLATDRRTHKVEELESNPHVFLLAGFELGGTQEILEIQGTASVTKNDSLRQKVWNDELKKWFEGSDDPNYIVLDIEPYRIEYTAPDQEREVWEK
ncbi:pyridoxamine 5'-phosphate oxidase family protein [Paenibacillus sp. GCM10028914]|uniref:pyridoxamine 5'-phosphate oxidase family protein n=1 Tax=Paenibacillus sp. GCM10028914 TaxID=3273416 RepID=UPI003606A4ED